MAGRGWLRAAALGALLAMVATPGVDAKETTTATDVAPFVSGGTSMSPPFACTRQDVCETDASPSGTMTATLSYNAADGAGPRTVTTYETVEAMVPVVHAKEIKVTATLDVRQLDATTTVLGEGSASMTIVGHMLVWDRNQTRKRWSYQTPVTVLAEAADGSADIGGSGPLVLTLAARVPGAPQTGEVGVAVTLEQIATIAAGAGSVVNASANMDAELEIVSVTYS